jgi:hypothetical protein
MSGTEPEGARHLCHDRHGDLGRTLGADIDADGAMDAGELFVCETRIFEALGT